MVLLFLISCTYGVLFFYLLGFVFLSFGSLIFWVQTCLWFFFSSGFLVSNFLFCFLEFCFFVSLFLAYDHLFFYSTDLLISSSFCLWSSSPQIFRSFCILSSGFLILWPSGWFLFFDLLHLSSDVLKLRFLFQVFRPCSHLGTIFFCLSGFLFFYFFKLLFLDYRLVSFGYSAWIIGLRVFRSSDFVVFWLSGNIIFVVFCNFIAFCFSGILVFWFPCDILALS